MRDISDKEIAFRARKFDDLWMLFAIFASSLAAVVLQINLFVLEWNTEDAREIKVNEHEKNNIKKSLQLQDIKSQLQIECTFKRQFSFVWWWPHTQ